MPQINLLPWREELRLKRNQDFGVYTGIAAALMGGVIFAVHTFYQQEIEFQETRNQYLTEQIAFLDNKIKEIQNLEKERERLIKRKEKIEELQSGRPDVVHLMDELVRALPEGVFYTSIEQKGGGLAVTGVAQSNARVSSLMRKIDASEWLENPALVEIKAENRQQGPGELIKLSAFSLRFSQTRKKKEGEGDEENSG